MSVLSSALSIVLSASIAFSGLTFSFSENVKAGRSDDFESADFTSYEYRTYKGDVINVGVDGPDFYVQSDYISNVKVTLYKADGNHKVKTFSEDGGSISCNVAEYMDDNVLYYAKIEYDVDESTITVNNNYLVYDNGDARFYRSPVYDFNVERCSELRDDPQSLQEMLMPQNDIECDDPVLISYAQQLCEGCTNDWEKVFHIYSYIIYYMSYDLVQTEDNYTGYQDGAVCLIRRDIAICEGFANLFTALCRAEGIPATVQFGIGIIDYDEMMAPGLPDDENCDHAWAAVYIDGTWFYVDPTYDVGSYFSGDSIETGRVIPGEPTLEYYLLPLEAFSYDHKICDADTIHGFESSGSCGENATYEITRDGTLTIYGSGKVILPYGCNNFNKVVFAPDSNIDCIGEECFTDCDLITSVILPDTVRTIEANAFNTCEDLEYVYIPEGVQTIGRRAFTTCDELSYIRIPDSCTYIGKFAFDGCPLLYLSLPDSIDLSEDSYYIHPLYIEYR